MVFQKTTNPDNFFKELICSVLNIWAREDVSDVLSAYPHFNKEHEDRLEFLLCASVNYVSQYLEQLSKEEYEALIKTNLHLQNWQVLADNLLDNPAPLRELNSREWEAIAVLLADEFCEGN